MPRSIDREERKRLIAQTAWGLVATQGLKGATVRNIAEAAHLSVGSVQHVFKSSKDIYLFAMEQAVASAAARIDAAPSSAHDPLAAVQHVLCELLPLDKTREVEARTWLAFTAEALVEPTLAEASSAMQHLLGQVARSCIEALDEAELLRADADRELEAVNLQAFVDGLTLQMLVAPKSLPASKAKGALRSYLQGICA